MAINLTGSLRCWVEFTITCLSDEKCHMAYEHLGRCRVRCYKKDTRAKEDTRTKKCLQEMNLQKIFLFLFFVRVTVLTPKYTIEG